MTYGKMRFQPVADEAGGDWIGGGGMVSGLLKDHGQRLGGSQYVRVRRNGVRGVAILGGCAAR